MINMEPVLKRGYATWDRDVLPQDEYEARLDAVREALRTQGLRALVVVNYSLLGALFDYADIAYLSGVQSGGALLVTLDDAPVLVSFGGGRELPFLRTQTWIRDVLPGAGRPFELVAEQLRARGIEGVALATVGTHGLAAGAVDRFAAAFAAYDPQEFDVQLAVMRAHKRPREITAIRIAKGIVDDALAAAFVAFAEGCENSGAMVAAERLARLRKARDVRVLASMSGAELRPFEGRVAGRHAPLRIWAAAQYQGYWAAAAGTYPAAHVSDSDKAVRAMRGAARAGVTAGEIAAAGLGVLPADSAAAALEYGLGGTIGLALDEGSAIAPASTRVLVEGSVLALHVHAANGRAAALSGALVSVGATSSTALEPLRIE